MKKVISILGVFFLIGCTKTEKFSVFEKDGLPVFRITTENKSPVNSKTIYQSANLTVNGEDPFTGEIEIRGRGNTTWTFPKKPYKIRLSSKKPLLSGLPAKEWVLLANYLDPSLMHNAVAMEIGHLLQMPFTNTIKPIDLWLNNEYLGNYMLTEQIEAKANRVEVGDGGLLLSLDTIIETDDLYFTSQEYDLPIQVKYPNNNNDITKIESDFAELERRINSEDFPTNNYLDLFDAEAMAKYLIVYTLTCNEEINHPKSTYIYRKPGGKFTMGPIWDFDWAFSYEANRIHYSDPTRPLFWNQASKGTIFFKRIASDPKIQKLMKQQWVSFRNNNFNDLIAFIDDYASLIEASREADFRKWQRGEANYDLEKAALINWLEHRARYMDELVSKY